MYLIVASFLVLSGAASLIYQVTWMRLLGLSMGNASASVATVLAAFFLGLAIGGLIAERFARRYTNALRPYLILEAVIGLSGIVLLPVLLNLDHMVAFAPALASWFSLKFILALMVLALPTIAMGATSPVMAALMVERETEIGSRLSLLYGLNTGGAVLGAALSGFWLIPNWGLDGAIYVAVALNFTIVAVGWLMSNTFSVAHPRPSIPSESSTSAVIIRYTPQQWRALAALFATGFAAISSQVGWTKYLSVFAGTTIYGFAAILTVFLAGIAGGSLLMKRRLDAIASPERLLALGLVVVGVALLVTRAGLTAVPSIYRAVNSLNEWPLLVHSVKYAVVFVLLILPTLLFGALFPLNLKLYCDSLHGLQTRLGRAYAVNTLAALLGAVCAGFWLIPTYGTNAVLTGSAFLLFAAALLYVPVLATVPRTAFATLVATGFILSTVLPSLRYQDLIASVQYTYDIDAKGVAAPQFKFLKEGATGVISVADYAQSNVRLQNNGLNESMINLNDPDDNLLVETLLGVLPYVAQSEPRSALVIGFGGGITTNALARTDLQHIDVIELEPVILEANRAVHNPHAEALNDSRVSLRINDARNDLIIRADRYDIIAAQPSHPWLARASNVFTQEFWELARKRLTPSGLFAQWVNLFNMDATTLRSVLKAFFSVFPQGCTFVDLNSGDLILLGSNTPIKLNMTRVDSIISSAAFQATLSAYNIRDSRDLLWYFGLSRENALHAAGDAPPNSDTNILSEVRLSALVSQPKGDEDVVAFIKTHYRADFAHYIDTADVTQLNYQQALHFAAGNYFFLANTLAQRLDITDALLARSVRYEILWRQFEYEAAFALYTAEHDWPARVHLLQALAWLTLQHPAEAFATLSHIDDPREYREAHARLLFETDDWEQLAALQPKSEGERRWYLATTAQPDAVSAGTHIESLLRTQDTPVALLRVMVRHASLANDAAELARWSRRLAKTVDDELHRAGALGTQAIDSAKLTKAKVILSYMEKLDPDARAVHALRWRLNRQ